MLDSGKGIERWTIEVLILNLALPYDLVKIISTLLKGGEPTRETRWTAASETAPPF